MTSSLKRQIYCIKIFVRISGPYFPVFGQKTKIYWVKTDFTANTIPIDFLNSRSILKSLYKWFLNDFLFVLVYEVNKTCNCSSLSGTQLLVYGMEPDSTLTTHFMGLLPDDSEKALSYLNKWSMMTQKDLCDSKF